MNVTIQHQEEIRFSARVGRHEVAIDLPEIHGGQDSGMAPPQLFVAALGGCAGVYVADYCDSQGIDYQGMRIELDWSMVERPRRIGSVRVRIELPETALSQAQTDGIRRSVLGCLLQNTLAQPPHFDADIVDDTDDARAPQPRPWCDSGACCRPVSLA